MSQSYKVKSKGYGFAVGPPGTVLEHDTYTCGHCQRLVTVTPFQDPASIGGLCKICMSLICPGCVGRGARGEPCTPWEKKMERMEARDRFLRSAGLDGVA